MTENEKLVELSVTDFELALQLAISQNRDYLIPYLIVLKGDVQYKVFKLLANTLKDESVVEKLYNSLVDAGKYQLESNIIDFNIFKEYGLYKSPKFGTTLKVKTTSISEVNEVFDLIQTKYLPLDDYMHGVTTIKRHIRDSHSVNAPIPDLCYGLMLYCDAISKDINYCRYLIAYGYLSNWSDDSVLECVIEATGYTKEFVKNEIEHINENMLYKTITH